MKSTIGLFSIILMVAALLPASQVPILGATDEYSEASVRGMEARTGLPVFSFEDTVTFMARERGGGSVAPSGGFDRRDDNFNITCLDGRTTTCSGSLQYCLGFCHGFCGGPCEEQTDEPVVL